MRTKTVRQESLPTFAISELKEEIELLSNGISAAYLGINGTEVSDAVADSQDMPKGLCKFRHAGFTGHAGRNSE